jgi:hypothetical protein
MEPSSNSGLIVIIKIVYIHYITVTEKGAFRLLFLI